jgi:hypothetical protein
VSWAWALVAPLPIQGAAMLYDELHFHRTRGLARWERIGHPLDTLTMLTCIGWALAAPPTARAAGVYAALAVVSCLFVTKDEFVHAQRCTAGEHWLHAILFLVHPVILVSVALLWVASHPAPSEGGWPPSLPALPGCLPDSATAVRILTWQFAGTAAFGLYQAAYWNLPWKRAQRTQPAR